MSGATSGTSGGASGGTVIANYGAWESPITSELIVEDSISIGDIAMRGDVVYWSETRPGEDGRSVIAWRFADGLGGDITPPGYSARTRVHEYGGGAFCVTDGDEGGSAVYFSNDGDQRIYRQAIGADGVVGAPTPITPPADMRYADGDICARRHVMLCVREDHTSAWRGEAVNAIAAIDLRSGGSRVVVSGRAFYSNPRISPDGTLLAWLSWNHPNMPWDGCELWVGTLLYDGGVVDERRIAGGVEESIFQPMWSPGGTLHFVSDRTGWWNIYRCTDVAGGAVEPVRAMDAEFGMPAWVFGLATYGFASEERIVCAYTQGGVWQLGEIDAASGALAPIRMMSNIDIGNLRVGANYAAFITGAPRLSTTLICWDLAENSGRAIQQTSDALWRLDREHMRSLRDPYDWPSEGAYQIVDVPSNNLTSLPQAIEFATTGGKTAHGFYYPPTNKGFAAPPGEKPPLIVISHGGPTSAASTALDLRKQFWTSRGFALLDVNYGGSSGYGRAYRRRLNGEWGVVDVDDCVNGAKHLVERGLADGARLIIRGSSAGGFTTLLALTTRDAFSAGASYYGICELEALMRDTHKFESRYLDTLIGAFPQHQERYKERSAINHIDGISAPMIVMQGLDDEIVPPNQAELLVNALREKGLPVAYLTFAGERHGFRKADSIRRALDAELYFYSQVFGFDMPSADGNVEPPIHIYNLRGRSAR